VRVVLRNPLVADERDYRHSLTVGGEYEVLASCVKMLSS
jgi:hypothetical protein